MTTREMQEALEIELKQSDSNYELKNKLESRELFYYLSRAQRDYVQDIYNTGVDKNEENKKKLGKLLVSVKIDDTHISTNLQYPNSQTVDLSHLTEEVLYVINERAEAEDPTLILVGNIYIKPISYDEYSVNKENPFRNSRKDKFLRLEGVSEHIILLPLNESWDLKNVYLDYIKAPKNLDIVNNCELHENVHYNIIKGAMKLIKGSEQNQVGYQIQNKEEIENK